MAQDQKIEFLFAAQVSGQEQLVKLTQSVDALRKEMDALKAANGPLAAGMGAVEGAARKSGKGLDEAAKAIRNTRQGTQQLGMQFNDLATSISTGASPLQAFNQQIGQIGYAMSMMQGKAGAVGRFLAGPWSILVIGAAMVISFLVDKFTAASAAASQLEVASSSLGSAQSALGDMFDTSTGKIKSNTTETRINTLAKIANLRVTAAEAGARAKAQFNKIIDPGVIQRAATIGGDVLNAFYDPKAGFLPGVFNKGYLENLQSGRKDLQATFAVADALFTELKGGSKTAGKELENLFQKGNPKLQQYIIDMNTAASYLDAAKAAQGSFDSGSLAAGLLGEDKKGAAAARAAARRAAAEAKRIAKQAEAERQKELKSIESFMEKIGKVGMKEIPAFQRDIAQLEKEFMDLSKAGQAATIEPFKAAVESIEMKQYSDMLKDDLKEADRMVKDALPNMGELPVSKEMQDIISKADEMEKSFETIGTTISNSFKGILTGAMSFKDAMKGIISAVIDELFRLFVVQQIVGIVSGALGGLKPGGASVGAFGSSTGNYLPGIKANAYGGSVMGNKPTLVGERGPELFVPGGNGTIIPNGNMRGSGGGSNFNISVDARGSNDPAAVRAQVQQGILEAAPAIIAAAESRTISSLRRPRLGGAMQ